jgi:hypothetical protein
MLSINPIDHWNQGADGTLKCLKHSDNVFLFWLGWFVISFLKRKPILCVFLCANLQLEKVNSNPDRFTKLNIQLIILHGPKTTTM